MSSYRAIRDVDRTLSELLWANLRSDTEITGILANQNQISFAAPFQLIENAEPDGNFLNLFLYRIAENGDLKNQPLERHEPNRLRIPPLALNLFYLLTPLTQNRDSWENAHRLLGKVMHVFYEHSIVRGQELQGELRTHAEELRIVLNPISLEDITKLWSALARPYHLSISYEVKVVFIDSERELTSEPVRRKRLEFTSKPAINGGEP